MTHPFHPWWGREFPFVVVQQTWRQDRVFFFGDDGALKSLPTSWTNAAEPDVFVVMSAAECAPQNTRLGYPLSTPAR